MSAAHTIRTVQGPSFWIYREMNISSLRKQFFGEFSVFCEIGSQDSSAHGISWYCFGQTKDREVRVGLQTQK